ncbi:entry exclusion protein TrbK [Rhizobium sp. PL01]|uniref:entry exclusion protein TrbK n=1 Tax=Rhizobium sp. PL01 TaxID=3085631 RepID=UPI0039951C1C
MSKFAIIALVVGAIGITSAAAFLAGEDGSRPHLSSDEQRQKTRDFFKPAPKRDLRSGQEMRPRW